MSAPTPSLDAAEGSDRQIERLVLDRELVDKRVLCLTAEDGTRVLFHLKTLTDAETRRVLKGHDPDFPAPPVIVRATPLGTSLAAFDLQDPTFRTQLTRWQERIGKALLGETLGLTLEEVEDLSTSFPSDVIFGIQSTVQLINGIHSEPLQILVRDAMWAPEVLSWIETYTDPDPDNLKITDTPMFREMEAMVAAGLTRAQWQDLSAKERLVYMEWHDAKQAKEAYVNWWTFKRPKGKPVAGRR